MDGITYKLEAFEGPFELLLHLINKNEINLWDIPIAELADQYIEAIAGLPPDMDSMSGFVLMAATLLEIKSRMLLPGQKEPEEEGEDPREQLARKIAEYSAFREIAEVFRELEKIGVRRAFRQPEDLCAALGLDHAKPDAAEILGDLTAERLYRVFLDVMGRRERITDKVRAGFNSVRKDRYTVEEKIEYLLKLLSGRRRNLSEIFGMCECKPEKVATFIALLELSRLKRVEIIQKGIFEEIEIVPQKGGA